MNLLRSRFLINNSLFSNMNNSALLLFLLRWIMPLISVIIPIYNSEQYLRKCLDSLINQTFSDFELILINDGSTDASEFICNEYTKQDQRVKLFKQKNAGQSAARNKGIREASGEWICFVDSDDCVNPCFLEFLFRAVKLFNVKMSVCGYLERICVSEEFFEKREFDGYCSFVNNDTISRIISDNSNIYCTICAKLIKREIVLQHFFDEGRIYEDNVAAPRWLFEVDKIAIVNLPLYFYTINNNSTTNQSFSLKQLDLLWAYEEQLKLLKEYNYTSIFSSIMFIYMNCVDSISVKLLSIKEIKKSKQVKKRGRKIVKKYISLIDVNVISKNRLRKFLHPIISRIII